MLELNQISIPVMQDYEKHLEKKIRSILHLDQKANLSVQIKKRSIDARKKPELHYVFTVILQLDEKTENKLLKNKKIKNLSRFQPVVYHIPEMKQGQNRPVVVGAGPAGLFAAYALALAGNPCLLIERGRSVENREKDVDAFFQTGVLKPNSNVQFGEGGAGTFSDGKLNTSVHDKDGKNTFVLETFVKFGADPSILIDPKPHVGTDVLREVIKQLREELIRLGTEVRFETALTNIQVENGKLTAIECNHKEIIPCNQMVLCIGHSARDTFEMLYNKQIKMQAKNFAVGFRVEHPQEFIDQSQYGRSRDYLPAANYKLTCNLENGRGIYSFCMCPGGYVVNSSSEENRLAVNGMSYAARDSANANSAIVVSVGEKEFDLNDPMGAIAYQRSLEEKAYSLGEGKIPQQLYQDFLEKKKSISYGSFSSITKGQATFSDMTDLFSDEIRSSFIEGMNFFQRKIKGFAMEDAILSGIESRTSSPIRIPRDEFGLSSIQGIFPCGEGAGYAGGITSAAMDGLRIIEMMQRKTHE